MKIKAVLFFCFYLSASVNAATDKTVTGPLTGDYITKLLLSLGLVVGIIFLLAWMVKRFNVIPHQSQGLIKIISTLSVGSRDRIALIQVGDEQLLIALSPGKISKLHSLKTPVDTSNSTNVSFKSKFNSLIDKQALKNKKADGGKIND